MLRDDSHSSLSYMIRLANCCFERRWLTCLQGQLQMGATQGGLVSNGDNRLPASPFSTSSTASITSISSARDALELIPPRYLRDSDVKNFDEVTKQRADVAYDNENGKPLSSPEAETKYAIRSCCLEGGCYRVEWVDGRLSQYSESWVEDTLARWQGREDEATPRILWTNLTEDDVRNDQSLSLSFYDILETDGMRLGLKTLYQYGILLVTETPLYDEGGAGIAALASAFSGGSVKESTSTSLLANYRSGGSMTVLPHGTEGPLRTLYGSVWSTSSSGQVDGTSVADSAYGKDALPLHTDMTYHRDPPGLQIFTMVQPALAGGESVFADGFAVAALLQSIDPEAFSILSRVDRTYHCIDENTGWHLQANGPVISVRNGVVTAIRHNDLDRLPDLPPYGTGTLESNAFYSSLDYAHKKWDELLARDEFRLVMSLRPGDTVVVANQRCFHGRYIFRGSDSSPRAVMGCYVSQDELNSRFRAEGFRVF